MTDFGSALRDLKETRIRFVLVGGIAVISHGVIRATRDIDAVIAQDGENLERVAQLIERWGATRPDGTPVPGSWVTPGRVINLLGPHGPVDLLPDKPPELAFEALAERASTRRVDGVEAAIVSLGDLVAFKRIAGRPRDEVDLAALEDALGELPEL